MKKAIINNTNIVKTSDIYADFQRTMGIKIELGVDLYDED